MANPCKLTPEMHKKIVTLIRIGNYVEIAAACAGINKVTFYEWLKRGARGEEPFASFAEEIHVAAAESESRDVATILQASQTYWQAAAWRLERKYPKRWSRMETIKTETVYPEAEDEMDVPAQIVRLRGVLAALESQQQENGKPS